MRLTHQIVALLAKELIIDPIHRHRYVATAIHVSVKVALIIDDKAFLIGASNLEQEFFGLARPQVVCLGNLVTNSWLAAPCLSLPVMSVGS
jgi:hypothetical protein